jgi:hypothetical protein
MFIAAAIVTAVAAIAGWKTATLITIGSGGRSHLPKMIERRPSVGPLGFHHISSRRTRRRRRAGPRRPNWVAKRRADLYARPDIAEFPSTMRPCASTAAAARTFLAAGGIPAAGAAGRR